MVTLLLHYIIHSFFSCGMASSSGNLCYALLQPKNDSNFCTILYRMIVCVLQQRPSTWMTKSMLVCRLLQQYFPKNETVLSDEVHHVDPSSNGQASHYFRIPMKMILRDFLHDLRKDSLSRQKSFPIDEVVYHTHQVIFVFVDQHVFFLYVDPEAENDIEMPTRPNPPLKCSNRKRKERCESDE